ncbi:MAG: ATP-dependent DNA helicase RecG [Ruminococcaceae bacterium]|nr:ATP-dependent DNA helicase RecG [Oscillospiraceae bacterium]
MYKSFLGVLGGLFPKRSPKKIMLNKPVTILKNVGDKRAAALAKMGITTVGDLVTHFPRAYQNRGDILTVEEVKGRLREKLASLTYAAEEKVSLYSDPCAVILTAASEPTVKNIRRGMTLVKFRAFDDTGMCDITYFNMGYMKDVVHTGDTFRFFGRFSLLGNRLQAANPIYEAVREGGTLPAIVPVYPLTAGITQKMMAQLTSDALRYARSALTEYLPPHILSEMALPAYSYTIDNLHRPESMAALEIAQRRRVFEELFFLFTALAASGNKKKQKSRYPMGDIDLSEFKSHLPFELTSAQERCVSEIARDLSGEFVMNRMLTGDVGSGKTVVAAAALYLAVKNGYRGAVMVPTEILAAQHYKDLSALFEPMGIRCALLTGSTPKRERDAILASLSPITMEGMGTDIVIGTHALISGGVEIDRLGLAVIDEQHRFGVAQRAALLEKCESLHSLTMSATPIPRTLTLALYGEIDVSRIDELPKGRQKIDTFVVNEGYRDRLNGFIRKQVDEGHQVYIVCPAVEEKKKDPSAEDAEEMSNVTFGSIWETETDLPPLKAAESYAASLAEQLPELNIAFVHGKLKPKQKDTVMQEFSAGNVDVLVSTTVIEVGVNVPNATLMIVENAERFGLSQLHQLRGRVGRGSAKSYFILVSDARGDTARQRLAAIKSTTDGFRIAEYDLEQRGPGDFLGSDSIKQHGQMRLSLAAGCRDTGLIERAVALAKATVADDPTLSKEENKGLAEKVQKLLRESENLVN